MQMNIKPTAKISNNKRHLRADGLILLPSALRPRLLDGQRWHGSETTNSRLQNLKNTEQSNSYFWAFFTANRYAKHQNFTKIVVMSTILFGFSVFLTNFSTPVSAASITLTLPSDPLSIDLSPVDEFKESDSASVSIATTDVNWGYNFSIKSKDGNTLKNGEFTLNSIPQSYTADNFKASAPVNTWGFKPSKKDSADNTNYLPGPTSAETLIEKTSSNGGSPINYTFSIAAKIDNTLKHGAYSNNFVLTVIANTASYNITYNLNSGSTGPNSPQTGTTTEKSIALDTTSPTRSGYEFLGWCTNNPGTAETCSGQSYAPGANYTLPGNNVDVTLYATWKKSGPASCRNGEGIVMKDGKCWSKSDVSTGAYWSTANTLCKTPWRLPSQSDFNSLIRAYYPSASPNGTGYYYSSGSTSAFAADWGATSGGWWSSTTNPSGPSFAYSLGLGSSSIFSYLSYGKTDTNCLVRCVSEV